MDQQNKHLVDGKYSFQDLVDMNRLREMFEQFSKATGFTTGLVSYPDQELLISTGWRDICTKFHRAFEASEVHCKQSNLELTSLLKNRKELNIRRCESGLADGATPIIIKGAHVANLATGQVLFKKPDQDWFKKQGQAFGYDIDAYLKALNDVPIVTEQELRNALKFLSEMAVMIADMGLTELKNREIAQAARENTEKFKGLVETSSDWIWEVDQRGVYTYASPQVSSMLGYEPHEILGKTPFDLMPPEEAARIGEVFTDAVQNGRSITALENVAIHKNGDRIVLETSGVPFFDATGKITGYRGVDRDITARKRAEEELQESMIRFHAFAEATQYGFGMANLDTTIVYMNAALCRMLGEPGLENAIGKSFSNYYSPKMVKKLENEVLPSLKDKGSWQGELELQTRDGRLVPVLENYFILNDKNGQPRYFADILTDITERKQQEAELNRLRNYLSNIIDSMPSLLVGVDGDGKITQWNVEAQRRTGISSEKALGQPLARAIPRLSAEMKRVREAMKNRKTLSDHKRVYHEDDGARYENITIYPLIVNGVDGAVIRIDDVTDRVRIEEMMVQSEKMMSVGGLAAGMAHEINNPLAGMIQTANVLSNRLSQEMDANDQAAKEAGTTMDAIRTFMEARGIPEMLMHIHESGQRAAKIVVDMLSFARKNEASFTLCDLRELLDQAINLASRDYDLKKKYDFRKIKIIRNYEKHPPLAPCEPSQIQQVLLNILRNGAEAMRQNPGAQSSFNLRLAHEQGDGMVRMEIEDNGPGMNEATRKRVFEPFFTTKDTDQGTGLGLSVSYFIITENHSGKMAVESAPNKGAKFIIHLPVESNTR